MLGLELCLLEHKFKTFGHCLEPAKWKEIGRKSERKENFEENKSKFKLNKLILYIYSN